MFFPFAYLNLFVSSASLNASHTEFTIPKEHLYTNIFSENDKLDPCRRFKSKIEGGEYHDDNSKTGMQYDECSPEHFYTNETVPCDDYIYSRDIFTNTLTSDINLVNI